MDGGCGGIAHRVEEVGKIVMGICLMVIGE